MEAVPKFETLSPLMPARMVNPTAFPAVDALAKLAGKPLFQRLVPFKVHMLASKYCAKKDSLVSGLIAKLNEATAISHSTLASLRLPGTIQALEQPIGLPSIIVSRNEEVRSSGGVKSLRDSFDTLCSMAKSNWALLNEVPSTYRGPKLYRPRSKGRCRNSLTIS
jgi:programmed cell death 6-interacting protein